MELLILGICLSIIAGLISGIVYKDLEVGFVIGSYSMFVVIILLNVANDKEKRIPNNCQEIELKLKGEK